MSPLISHDRFDLAVIAAVGTVFAVCLALEGIAWFRRRPRFNRRYRIAVTERPLIRPGRPGRASLRIVENTGRDIGFKANRRKHADGYIAPN